MNYSNLFLLIKYIFGIRTMISSLALLSTAALIITPTASCKEQTQAERPLMIFAASDLRYAMEDLKDEFIKKFPEAKIDTVYGSSGKAYTQIKNSAPYDLFFSANMDYPLRLQEEGLTEGGVHLYALGYIVIWTKSGSGYDASRGYDFLKEQNVKKIAIANPEHAPYGVASMEALKTHNLWDELQPKFVLGENISQAAQFVSSGAADAGIIAWSLALAPEMRKMEGSIYRISPKDHKELRQGFAIIKSEKKHPLAQPFSEFIRSREAKQIMKKYGFEVPEK